METATRRTLKILAYCFLALAGVLWVLAQNQTSDADKLAFRRVALQTGFVGFGLLL